MRAHGANVQHAATNGTDKGDMIFFERLLNKLRKFMFKNIYLGTHLKEERNKAKFVLEQLVNYYVKNSNELPDVYKKIEESEGTKRAVADYIAGMSDDYCLATFNKIYVPKFVIF